MYFFPFLLFRLLPVKELRNTSSAVLPLWYPVEPLLKDNEHVFALCNGFEENEETLRGHLDISETEDSSGYISVRQRDGNSTPLPVKQNLLSSTELQDSHDTHKRSKRSKRKRKLQKADEYGPVNSTQGKARLSELEGELQPESEVIRPAASNSIRESGSKLNVSTSTVSVNAISGETRDENGVKQKKIRKNSIQKEVSPSVEKSLAQVEVAEAVNTSARKPSTLSAELSERTTDDESGSIKKQNHSKTERHTEIETAALSDENLISCQQENSLCHTTNDHHDLHSTKETANHEGRSENVSNIGFVYEKTKMKSSKSKGKEILETTGKDSEGVSKVRNESGTDECVFKSSRDTSGANSVGNLDSSMVSQETDKNMNKSSSKKKRKKSKDRESIKEDTDMVHAKSASKDHHLTEKQPVCESNSNLESDENFKKSSKKKKKDKSDKESKEREKNSVGESSAADDCSSRKKKKKHKNKEKGKGEKERVQRSTEKDAGEETVAQIDMKDHTAVNNLPSDENTVDGATKSKDEQEKDVVEVSSHLKQKISKPTNEDSFNKDSSPKNRKEKKRKHSDTCLSESNDTVSEAMLQNENNLKQGDSHETAKKKSESTELLSSQQTSQEIFKKPFSPSQELSQQSHQQSSQTTSQKIRTKRKKDEGSIDLFTDNSPGKESKQEQNITSMNQPIPKAPKFTSSSSDSESSSSLSISDYSGRIVRKLKQDKATKSGKRYFHNLLKVAIFTTQARNWPLL